MTNILLTGIPGSNKTELTENARVLSLEFYEQDVDGESLGSRVAHLSRQFWQSPAEARPLIEPSFHEVLRYAALEETAHDLLRRQVEGWSGHTVVDTPLTMFFGGMIPDVIYNWHDIGRLSNACGGFNYAVTVIEDANRVSDALEGTPYPRDADRLLDWMAFEVGATRAVMPHIVGEDGRERPLRHVVIPREHSEETLAKLLNDPQPETWYFGMPITHAKNDEETMEAILAFIDRMQEHTIPIVPIISSDSRVGGANEQANIIHRDFHWFVKGVNGMLAYFPKDLPSMGVPAEMRHTKNMGKPVIMIRPNYKDGKEVFGVRPDIGYRTAEEFFEALSTCQEPRFDDQPGRLLRTFLDTEQPVPRYAHMRSYAVAVDIRNAKGQHLIAEQAPGKSLAGQWMFIAGKRERSEGRWETAHEALHREVWQEVGLHVDEISPDYQIFPVDYGPVEYVRIYRAVSHEGKVRSDNVTEHPEIARTRWASARHLLTSMRDQLVPATRDYLERASLRGR